MLQTLLITLKLHFRQKIQLFWLFAFPIILATMFNGMFGNISESYKLHTFDMAVIENANWKANPGLQTLVDGISTGKGSSGSGMEGRVTDGDDGMPKLINVVSTTSRASADRLLADGKAQGYLYADSDGRLHMAVSESTQSNATDVMANSGSLGISLTMLNNIVDLYNRNDMAVADILATNPTAMMDRRLASSIGASSGYTKEVKLTNFKPDGTARYYYALLGMTALMAMSFAVNAVTMAQANLSALGIRRSVAPLAKWKQLAAGFLASWFCSFLSLAVAMLYIHFICGISLGGREWAAFGSCAAAAFSASAFGTFIGALPKMPTGAKHGLCTTISCVLSIFSGLYGSFAMDLSDMIARRAPLLSLMNPAQQITNLFYDILYYDSFAPLFRTLGTLLAMSAICLTAAVAFLRRQRYEYL